MSRLALSVIEGKNRVVVHSDLKVRKLNSDLSVDNGKTLVNLRRWRMRPSEAVFIPTAPLLLFLLLLFHFVFAGTK